MAVIGSAKNSGRFTATVRVPLTGKATDIQDGTLIMPGVTQGTDLGLAIPVPAGNAGSATIGICKGLFTASGYDSVQAGTTWTFWDVELIDSTNLVELEYSQVTADTLSVGSTSGTTVTIGSLENNADTSWLFAVSGTGAGLLAFCSAMTGGTATTKNATGWDSTTKVIKILRFGHTVVPLNAVSKIKTTAAVGTFTVFIFETYIEAPGYGISKQLIDPTKHDNITFPSGAFPKFTARVGIRSNAGR